MLRRTIYAALFLALTTAPALGECLPLKDFTDQLKTKYGETPEVYAISGHMPIIIFVSHKSGTYTMVGLVESAHLACTLAAGTDWREVNSPQGDPL